MQLGTHCTKIVGSQPSPDEAAEPTLAAHNNARMGGSWCYLMVAQGRAMETVQGKQDKPIIIVGNASLCQEADQHILQVPTCDDNDTL